MGHTPYGYSIENGCATIKEDEANKIRKIRKRRYGLTVALELGLALLVGSLDSSLNFGDGLGVGLRDDETHAVLGSAAVDGFRLPDVRVAPAGVNTGDNLHGIADFYILTHCRFPP